MAILLLGLGLRADYAWEGRAPVFDAVAYGQIAENLSEGHGFTLGEHATQPAGNYSPGLPLLVSGLYELSGGADERFARLVLALVGALAVLFTYLIGRRLHSPAAGLVGAAAVAIYPGLLEYQGMLMAEPLAATLLSGAILSMLWAASPDVGGRQAAWLLPGVLLGALALVRPEYLGVALLLALVACAWGAREPTSGAGEWAWETRAWRRSLLNGAILLAGVVLVVGPWTVRNAVVLDRFVPISTGGGQVLFAGAYMPSEGDPERVGEEVLERHPGLTKRLASEYAADRSPAAQREAVLERVRLEQILTALAAQRYPGLETDRALSRMGRERLWDAISEEPLQYTGFLARKVARLWSPGPRDVMHKPVWQLLHWALLALGLAGLVLLARQRRREALLFAVVFLAITAISALLVASPRRVLVVMPLVSALAGLALAWLWAETGRRRPPEGIDDELPGDHSPSPPRRPAPG